MAIFTNQATLVYNGGSANSNIAVGEILPFPGPMLPASW